MGKISMQQGKGSQMHNRRDYEKVGGQMPKNIDVARLDENIVLVDKDIRQAYDEIFGEVLEEYNAKQKRADRKIINYIDHIKKSKNGEKVFYEDVVQFGKMEDFQNQEMREKAKAALIKYATSFEQRNPNLKVIGSYIHMDEASPHLHLDYIPVADGYSRGLAKRNSLDRAMKAMGFLPENESRKNNATKLWKENEKAYFAEICQSLGLEVEPEEKNSTRKHLSPEEYREAAEEMKAEVVREKEVLVAEINEIDVPGQRLPVGDKVIVQGTDLERIKTQAKAYVIGKTEIDAVAGREQELEAREKELEARAEKINAEETKARDLYQRARQMYDEQREINFELEDTKKSLSFWKEEANRVDNTIRELKIDNSTLKSKISVLETKFDERLSAATQKLNAENTALRNEITSLRAKIGIISKALANALKALRMFLHDKKRGYGITPSNTQQEHLILATDSYVCKALRAAGQEEPENVYGIAPEIQEKINELELKAKHRSYSPER